MTNRSAGGAENSGKKVVPDKNARSQHSRVAKPTAFPLNVGCPPRNDSEDLGKSLAGGTEQRYAARPMAGPTSGVSGTGTEKFVPGF